MDKANVQQKEPTMTSVTVRLDDDLKRSATEVVKSYGLDLPTALKMFIVNVAQTQRLPIKFDYETNSDVEPFATEEEAMDFIRHNARRLLNENW
jgi:addiction module RelB/DinJ family antitoxin